MYKGTNYRSSKRRREVFLKKICIAFALAAVIMTGSIIGGSRLVSAHERSSADTVEYRYYKSIEVKNGDSLWTIAKRYMNDDYDSVYDYIDDLKEINHLSSDRIHAGQYLTVSYYDTEIR